MTFATVSPWPHRCILDLEAGNFRTVFSYETFSNETKEKIDGCYGISL
jgi:hypothetical protein